MPIRLRLALAGFAVAHAGVAGAVEEPPRGVNPKENLSKIELIYKGDALDGDGRIDAFTVKFDRAITPLLGANVEMPLLRFDAPGLTETGLGDVMLRLRYNLQYGAITVIPGLEVVAPTASDDVLGLGKWQVNPVLGAVMPLSQSAFVFVGYKHLRSVGGDDARLDIDASQPRLLVARLSPRGWWVLADMKYTYDHGTGIEGLDAELEFGQMLSHDVGLSARIGTSALESPRNSTVGLNLRYLF